MSKGDYTTTGEDNQTPPDFCAMGEHSYEIIVTDTVERVCNDCGLRETVQPTECIDRHGNWYHEHMFHFGICYRCDTEDKS